MVLKKFKKKSSLVIFCLVVVSIILEALFRTFPDFAEFYTLHVSSFLKHIFIPVSLIPFSLSETLVLVFILLFVLLLSSICVDAVFHIFKKEVCFNYKAIFVLIVHALAVVFILFVFTFSSSYHRHSVAHHLELDTNIEENELIEATELVLYELTEISDSIPYTPYTPSSHNMNFRKLSEELRHCAEKAEKKYPFLRGSGSRPKPLVSSELLTYMHIAGIYTFFTGEPCINTNYSSYTLPYTIAHELAHQHGIGAENEADFVAFLIAMESDVPYVRYSALAEAFVSLSNELYTVNPDAFLSICAKLPHVILNDFDFERSYYSKYSDSQLSEISSTVNDTYLKANGVDEGVRSYSQSVILLTAYLTEKEKIS